MIKRSAKPLAHIGPLERKRGVRALKDLESILKALPRLDDELEAFASDLKEISKQQPLLLKGARWI